MFDRDKLTLHSWVFGADGKWEEALYVDATKPIDIPHVQKWVKENAQNIAFEAIFALDGVPITMYGIRIAALPKPEQVACITDILECTHQIKKEGDFVRLAQKLLPNFSLFPVQPSSLVLGIVGQWFSFGEVVLREGAHGKALSYEELGQQAPRYLQPTQNPAAVEFWRPEPINHWYKIYVSDYVDNSYILNAEKYTHAITDPEAVNYAY